MQFLAISGSLRSSSTNTALLRTMALHAPGGVRVDLFDGMGGLPIFNPDQEGDRTPDPVARMIDQMASCDGVIVASPEYAHGVPGGLKNALDWMVSRDVAVGKPALMVHASSRSIISRAQLSEILKTMSFRLQDDNPLEIALLGKAPEAMRGLLEADDTIRRIGGCLTSFSAFAKSDD